MPLGTVGSVGFAKNQKTPALYVVQDAGILSE
jgi:hypothetical protein